MNVTFQCSLNNLYNDKIEHSFNVFPNIHITKKKRYENIQILFLEVNRKISKAFLEHIFVSWACMLLHFMLPDRTLIQMLVTHQRLVI